MENNYGTGVKCMKENLWIIDAKVMEKRHGQTVIFMRDIGLINAGITDFTVEEEEETENK